MTTVSDRNFIGNVSQKCYWPVMQSEIRRTKHYNSPGTFKLGHVISPWEVMF